MLANLFDVATSDEDSEANNSTYQLVTFPQGVKYSAVAYDIGGAYITADTLYPDACYNFIRSLSERATLFNSMPARRSVINSDILAQVQGGSAVAFFSELDNLLQQPNVVEFPTAQTADFSQIGDLLSILWLFRAMDDYVLEDADLLAELQDAQQFTIDYQACVAEIPAFNAQDDRNIQDFFVPYAQCAVDVDETTRSIFVGIDLE